MKRIIAILIVSALLVAFPSAYAEATHRRGVIEFCELYMYRFMKMQREADLDYSIHILEPYSSPRNLGSDTILLNSVAGSMEVSTEDYTVKSITLHYVDLHDTDQNNEQTGLSCIVAFSALEYNEMDELELRVNANLYGGSGTAVEEAIHIFTDYLSDTFIDAMNRARDTGKEVKIYTGNYDYYVAYNHYVAYNPIQQANEQHEYYYLIAREHA